MTGCLVWKTSDKLYSISDRRAFSSPLFLLLFVSDLFLRQKRMWKSWFPRHTAVWREYNMPINNYMAPLLLLRIMKEWEYWPQAEFLLKCFQLTFGTSRKASNLSHAEIWKICRVLLSRGRISWKRAHHNSATSAPPLSLSIDKETGVIFMDCQRGMIS